MYWAFAFGGAHEIGPAAAGEDAAAAGVETTPGARSFAIRLDLGTQ